MPTPEMARIFHSQVAARGRRSSEVWLVLRALPEDRHRPLCGFAGAGIKLLRTGRVSLRLEHIERRRRTRRPARCGGRQEGRGGGVTTIYDYYPGCSMKGTGRAYEESMRAVSPTLGLRAEELDDWNCCGATSYMSVRRGAALALPSRRATSPSPSKQAAATSSRRARPASPILRKTDHYLAEFPELRARWPGAGGRRASGTSRAASGAPPARGVAPRIGLDGVRSLVQAAHGPQGGALLRLPDRAPVASTSTTPSNPTDASTACSRRSAPPSIYYPLKTRCCGASLMGSPSEAALRLCRNLLLVRPAERGPTASSPPARSAR